MRLITQNFASLSQTTVTASSENLNFPVANIKHEHRSKEWRSSDVVSEHVTFDLKAAEQVDSVVLLWGQGQYNLSSSAVIKVQANPSNVWTSPALEQTLTFNNDFELASHYFATPENYRYWRIVIEDPTNILGYVNLGVILLGKGEEIGDAENGFTFTQNDNSRIVTTDFGQQYADIYPTIKSISLDFDLMEYETSQLIQNIYSRVGNRYPVFVAVDETDLVLNKDAFAIYGKIQGSNSLKHNVFKYFSSSIVIVEVN